MTKQSEVSFRPLLEWFTQVGLSDAELEVQEHLLIIKLSPVVRSRLLADSSLRTQIISQAQSLGFSRVALELLI